MSFSPLKPEEPKDFINEVTNFILKHKDIPTSSDWAEANARTLINAVCNIKCLGREAPFNMNSKTIIVSLSGMYKGFPIRAVVHPILYEVHKLTKKDFIIPSDRCSIEGIIDWIHENPSGVEYRAEFTGLFAQFYHKKTYMAELEDYSKLFDGALIKRKIRKELISVVNYNFNLLGCTTSHLYKLLKMEMFIQGLGNRMDFIYDLDRELRDFRKNPFEFDYEEQQEQKKQIREYAQWLAQLHNFTQDLNMSVHGIEFLEFRKECLAEEDKLFRVYAMRLWSKAVSYAMTKELSCFYPKMPFVPKGTNSIIIRPKSVKYGIETAKKYFVNFKKLILDWRVYQEEHGEPSGVRVWSKERVYDILINHGSKISATQLKEIYKVPSPTKYLKALQEEGKAEVDRTPNPYGVGTCIKMWYPCQ